MYLATVDTLQDLAFQGCETLETLALQFQNDAFDAPPELPTQKSTHPLRHLTIITDVEDNDIAYCLRHKVTIAKFLDRLFPSLIRVDGTARGLWEDVNVLIESFQESRKQSN